MNLFFRKLFGILESTDKVELKDKKLLAELISYKKFEGSEEYAEYNRLFEIINSADFTEKKKMLTTRKYKDTQEYQDLKNFDKLESNSDIKTYYKTLSSKKLKDYLEFKDTNDYYKLRDKEELAKSPKLREYKDFENSKDYKTYVRFHESHLVEEYERLKEKISTPEFKESNKFWQNPNRWADTEEAELERKLNEIKNSEEGKFFFSTKPSKFKRIEGLVVYQKDKFEYKSLKDSTLEPGFYYSNPKLQSIHSLVDEAQANMGGKNVSIGTGLFIKTKKENATALTWDPNKGFIEKSFEFTSDTVNGYKLVPESGYCGIRVKMRCNGNNVHHSFWLSSGEKIPHINVALIKGKTIEVGVHDARGDYYYTTVKGINPADYYIYSIYQKDDSLIWKINNIEVFRTRNIISERSFYPAFSSFIPNQLKQKASEGVLEIEWLEIYK